ncbi:Non-specific lipid-transfer protein 2-like protein [Drosera capensis]
MNKQLSNLTATLAIVAIAFVILNPAVVADGVTCNVYELAPCAGAILSSSAPSSACCSKMQEQKPCLCGYYKDPSLAQYVNSPGAKKVTSSCGVAVKC